MANVNVFIEQNKTSIHTYFDAIAQSFPYIPPEESKWPKAPKDIRHHALGCIHKNLVANIEGIENDLQSTSPATAQGLKIFVQSVLGQIGAPIEMGKNDSTPTSYASTSGKVKKEDSRF